MRWNTTLLLRSFGFFCLVSLLLALVYFSQLHLLRCENARVDFRNAAGKELQRLHLQVQELEQDAVQYQLWIARQEACGMEVVRHAKMIARNQDNGLACLCRNAGTPEIVCLKIRTN